MFQIYLDTSNAAFDGLPNMEIARILREIAEKVSNGDLEGTVRDVNGSRVGQFAAVESN